MQMLARLSNGEFNQEQFFWQSRQQKCPLYSVISCTENCLIYKVDYTKAFLMKLSSNVKQPKKCTTNDNFVILSEIENHQHWYYLSPYLVFHRRYYLSYCPQDSRLVPFLSAGMTSHDRSRVQIALQMITTASTLDSFPVVLYVFPCPFTSQVW